MLNTLIARREEQAELLDAYQSKQAEFIVLYGRRRIGKTFLIEELYGTQKGFYFQSTGIKEGKLNPALIIGAPVGFVNVVESKELIMEAGVPFIVPKGRKGGSNIAATICNAMLYQL